MEKLFKKIQKYKDSIDGPFFCILSGAHDTASLFKNVSAGVVLKCCFDAVWEARANKDVTPATYMELVMFCALACLKEHESKITAEDAAIFNHLSCELADLSKAGRSSKESK